jgi:cell division protein FtsB
MNKRIILTIILLIGSIIAFIGIYSSVQRVRDLQKQLTFLQQENERIEAENQQISSLLNSLNFNEVKEIEIKKRLQLVKPGEEVIVFVSPSPLSQINSEENQSFWQKIKDILKLR